MRVEQMERDIVERIKAAKIRLRFDSVVVWLVSQLQTALATVVPDKEAVVFTVTAPIRLPAKTAAALENLARDCRPNGECHEVIHGNQIRIRRLTNVPSGRPKVLGFVHNPDSDAGFILTLAKSRLLDQQT